MTIFPVADYDLTTKDGQFNKDIAPVFHDAPPAIGNGLFGIALRYTSFKNISQQPASPPPSSYDARPYQERHLKHAAMHEFGHLIGFGDVPETCASVMAVHTYDTLAEANAAGFKPLKTPTAQDKTAVDRLYGIK